MKKIEDFFNESAANALEMVPSIYKPVFDGTLADGLYGFSGFMVEEFVKALEFQQIAFDKWINPLKDDDKEEEPEKPVAPSEPEDPADDPDAPELPGTTDDPEDEPEITDDPSGVDRLTAALDKLGEKLDAAKDFWSNFGAAGTQMVVKVDPWTNFLLDRCDEFFDTPQQVAGDDTMDSSDDVWMMYSRDDEGNLLVSWGRSKKELQAALDAYTDNKDKLAFAFEPLVSVDDSWKDGWNPEKDKTSKSDGALSAGFLGVW
ncbi:MAG: hypothetical protein IJW33_07170 [Lentisphaeria bacterium]|nr:hypothetical protein [Lentisphaeria bacterium]